MGRVTGIGGIFFKAEDPKKLKAWYEHYLGLHSQPDDDSVVFEWREAADPNAVGQTVWSLFPRDTKYFDPGRAGFMVNYRVADLDDMLARLRAEGTAVDEKQEDTSYGRFAWITDPEGNRIELWEPPVEEQT